MRIAIASGKGGTGKTTVATNLSLVAAENGISAAYIDCDVEEPNGHIFLKPTIQDTHAVGAMIPLVNEKACIHCGVCSDICLYNAIVCMGKKVIVYPELCHSCGGCSLLCPAGVITEVATEIGNVKFGNSGKIKFVAGYLKIGQPSSPPLIRAVKNRIPEADIVFVDAPPGTACAPIEALRGCDLAVFVSEPTPFGLHDLKRAVETARAIDIPCVSVINRSDIGDANVQAYCVDEGIPILAEIPNDRTIAENYARGEMICETSTRYKELFSKLLSKIQSAASENRQGVNQL